MTNDRGKIFKGIALFTPGGDLIYCIDLNKQNRWHLHLCAGLQEILGLAEPPHFLVPCFTATIDKWLDRRTGEVKISAEAYPPVLRHQALLNAVFETGELIWQAAPWPDELCNPLLLATYRQEFPQLWEENELVVRFDRNVVHPRFQSDLYSPLPKLPDTQGYVLRLFVSGHNASTERTLKTLYNFLEQSVYQPYTLKVIDVFKHPEQAEADQVSATPTLVKVWPRPVRRIVGEIEDVNTILRLLVSPEV
ncbi:MAG TPA: circadian clock KaiB family protein [Leptolyngbyaceae cyanobacterium]